MMFKTANVGNNQAMDMDDFHLMYVAKALSQGWLLSEIDVAGNGTIQVQKVDDPVQVGAEWNMHVPELVDDADAVNQLKAAYVRGEDHARVAYKILQLHSRSEFEHWGMQEWQNLIT